MTIGPVPGFFIAREVFGMASSELTVDVRAAELSKHIMLNVRFKGARLLSIRTRLGLWVIKAGARVIGCNLDLGVKA